MTWLLLSVSLACPSLCQTQASRTDQKAVSADGTIRVRVGLVQTDVTVVDKQGRLVDDLKRDQFELLVDGKPQQISFLELVTATAPAPEPKSREIAPGAPAPSASRPDPAAIGRTLLFFIDDWHLSADSTIRSGAMLSKLLDSNMGPNDKAAIFTASRQLGFLQQLTDNKAVLQRALEKLSFTNETVEDPDLPRMDEADAASIEMGDSDTLAAFVAETMKITLMDRPSATALVRARAAALARVSAEVTSRTLGSLRSIVRSCAALPGRKVLFFLSDGFALQMYSDDIVHKLRLVTDAAANAGIVIYTLDARGLVGLETHRYISKQDGLNALASDTGGRFIKNTNALDAAIVKTLEETSRYYLLAWHVDPDKVKNGHYSSIRVEIRGRPDLKAHVRKNSINLSSLLSDERDRALAAAPGSSIRDALVKALEYPWPINDLLTFLHAGFAYMSGRKDYVLGIAVQADVERRETATEGAAGEDQVDVMAVVSNRDGNTVSFFQVSLDKTAEVPVRAESSNRQFVCSRAVSIGPGIYQIRVAARDARTGRVGSAHQWVEVPRPDAGRIQVSSIFLARSQEADSGVDALLAHVVFDEKQVSVSCRQDPGAGLSYWIQIYNPDAIPLALHTRIYRGNQRVVQLAPLSVPEQDSSGTAPQFLGSSVSIGNLAHGSYVLELMLVNSSGNFYALRRVPFSIQ